MERSSVDAKLWLPSEEDLLLDRENLKRLCFPTEFPYEVDSLGFNSALSSPVGSSSTETTESSDEEDFFAGLTRRLAQSSINETWKLGGAPGFARKSWPGLAGSPESTLSGIGSWSASSNGSPNGPSQSTSPPATPFGSGNDTWDLIFAAAGEVARLKMNRPSRTFMNTHRSAGQAPPPVMLSRNQNAAFYSHNCLSNANEFRQARHEQMMKQQDSSVWERQMKMSGWSQNRGRSVGYNQPLGLPQSSWPSLQMQNQYPQSQQHASSGNRAVFLGDSQLKKKKCTGTGVFLPRRYGDQPDSRRKAGSPVLLPPKVVQALNLSFNDMNGEMGQLRFSDQENGMFGNKNGILKQQRRNLWGEGPLSHELRLPQEWTY